MVNFIMQSSAGAGAPPSLLANPIFMMIGIGLIFYFLLIRPQNKRLKEHKAKLDAVVRGDTIITNGGLIGKVTKVGDEELTVDFGGGTKFHVVRTMLADVRGKSTPANDTGKKDSNKKAAKAKTSD